LVIWSLLTVAPFTQANAQQLPENQIIRYLESLAKSDGGYGWEDQYDSHLTPTFAVVGSLYNLGRLPENKENLIEFIRTRHPQKGPNREAGPSGTELRNLVYQQIQGIIWLGGDPSTFSAEVRTWKSQAGKLANYEKKGYPVLMQELMTPICRGLLNLPSSDVKVEFESLLNSRKRENGSYNNAPSADGGDGNILNTWWSLYALHQSGSFNQASPGAVAWIKKCQLENGGFTHQPDPEIGRNDEVAYTWAAVKSLDLFSAAPANPKACIQYLLSLRNPDGGFGNRPGLPSTPMATFYAIDALKTMNALSSLKDALEVVRPQKEKKDFSGYKIYTVQFQAGGTGSPEEAVMLADSLDIHLWGTKNAGAGWIETAQKIADENKVAVTFFQSDESHERNVYVPGMGTFGHILDYFAPAGDGMVPFKKATSVQDFRRSAIGLKESSTWAELREAAILPLAKNHGGFVLQVSNNEPLSRILLDESVNNGGYLAISTVHFGQNFLFWLPHLNQYRYQLPFIAMQDFHGIESWWWGNDLVAYRTLFLAKKPDVEELYTALKNNWVVALRHDSISDYKTRMLGGTTEARTFIQSRQKEWQWWNDDTQEMNHPWAAITVVEPTDTLEAGRPETGVNIRIRCWWQGVRQNIKEPLVALEQLHVDNLLIPQESIKQVERKNVDSYYLYSLPNLAQGEHQIKVTLRHLKTNEVRIMVKKFKK
jgi:prenyltransferase beta subunit